jgi:hypothetical protein
MYISKLSLHHYRYENTLKEKIEIIPRNLKE